MGCGDSFGAAITMGFIRGCREDVTLTLANAVGAATAMGRGAGRQVATAGGVARILRDQARGAAGRGALELVQGALGAPVGGGHG